MPNSNIDTEDNGNELLNKYITKFSNMNIYITIVISNSDTIISVFILVLLIQVPFGTAS